MKLNHINLVVADVQAAVHFFETFFNFKCQEIKGDNIIAILKGVDGFSLVLLKNKNGVPIYPKAFHIGFMQNSKTEVIEIYRKLQIAGFTGEGEPKEIRGGFGFYFHFEKIMIEVGV